MASHPRRKLEHFRLAQGRAESGALEPWAGHGSGPLVSRSPGSEQQRGNDRWWRSRPSRRPIRPNNTLHRLTNTSGYSDRLYAFLTTRPNGQVELMGPPGTMNTINTSGTGAITATKARDNISALMAASPPTT